MMQPSKGYQRLHRFMVVLAMLSLGECLLTAGFRLAMGAAWELGAAFINTLCFVGYLAWLGLRIRQNGWKPHRFASDIALIAIILVLLVPLRITGALIAVRIIFSALLKLFTGGVSQALASTIRLNPARLLLLTFLGAIFAGTALLMLPAASTGDRGAGFITALFTSASAVCVTGLTVADTGSFFSLFGQLVILGLIQVGGLGIMTFSTLFAIVLGRRIGLRQQEQLRGIMEQSSAGETYRLIVHIIVITVVCEVLGAAVLFTRWVGDLGIIRGAYYAVFHSISAFCNAGFSLFPQNLAGFSTDLSVNLTIVALIVTGGLGFVVLDDLIRNSVGGNPLAIRWSRLSTHSRLVLVTTAALIGVGTLAVFFFEFDNAMLALPMPGKLLAALFQSVTFRTAGFNTIDFGACRTVTLFIGILLMFIGASPSSTGGGIKTTTFAILVVSVRALFFSRERVEVFNRTVPFQTVYKSIAILFFSLSLLVVFAILMLATQEADFIDLLFEITSAMGTVGLSTGITPTLTGIGKIFLVILMYIGRVGPLTVAFAIGEGKKVNVAYPETRVSVG